MIHLDTFPRSIISIRLTEKPAKVSCRRCGRWVRSLDLHEPEICAATLQGRNQSTPSEEGVAMRL